MRGRRVAFAAVALCAIASAGRVASAADPDPTAVVVPTTVVPGDALTVRARGFAPGDLVDLFFDDRDLAVVRTDDTGHAEGRIEVPSDAGPGRHWVTVMARASGFAAQRPVTVVGPAVVWPQVGNDPGRTGAAPGERILTAASAVDLKELWWRDLEVLGPGEQIFVTDAAGEVAEPAAVADGAIVATWSGDVIDATYREEQRTLLAVLDLDTGAVRWQRGATFRGGVNRPVVLGDLVVVRWWNERVLLGLDLQDGSERWRLDLPERSRFGEPLVVGDTILVPVDLPGAAVDAVWTVDPQGHEVASWDVGAGSAWQLVAGRDVVVGVGSRSIVALDRSTGARRWTDEGGTWWGMPLVAGDVVVVPGDTGQVRALRLTDGSERWVWRAWPHGCTGCADPSAYPGGAIGRSVFVRSATTVCPAHDEVYGCPYRVRLSALDLAFGRQRWFRQQTETYVATIVSPLPGPVALTPEVLVGAGSLVDLRDGSLLTSIPPPARPNTFGAQHLWFGRPIVSGGRVVLGAADGTITLFSVERDHPRPLPAGLTVDPSLPTPTPTPSPVPTAAPAPPPGEPSSAPWAIAAICIAAVAIATGGLVLLRRRRRTRAVRHVPHTGPT